MKATDKDDVKAQVKRLEERERERDKIRKLRLLGFWLLIKTT